MTRKAALKQARRITARDPREVKLRAFHRHGRCVVEVQERMSHSLWKKFKFQSHKMSRLQIADAPTWDTALRQIRSGFLK